MAQRIKIHPITRLEGHGKIEIFLDDIGNVSSAYFMVPELRGSEQFVVGRPAEEMPLKIEIRDSAGTLAAGNPAVS